MQGEAWGVREREIRTEEGLPHARSEVWSLAGQSKQPGNAPIALVMPELNRGFDLQDS